MNNFHDIMHAASFHINNDKVWLPESMAEFAYNDGDQAELYLLDVMKNTIDKSCESVELASKMIDWPSTYHLTSRRSNLLKPFAEIFAGKKVLEIGCGCGAITRFLGEAGAHVISVEGSLRRATIARQRCSDLSNVEVICSPSNELPELGEFDYVLLIGVLEYARVFLGEAGQQELIAFCKSKLKQDGSLFVAIENKLGIKYFAGAAEDHVGQPMFGINNSYNKDGVMTFGRQELKDILCEAGLNEIEEYLPLPDYKLPTDIVTPLGWKKHAKKLSQLAIESANKDAQGIAEPLFSLEQGIKSVWENNLAPDLSNSFLFIASRAEECKEFTGNHVLYHFSDGRLPHFNKTIKILDIEDKLVVSTAVKNSLKDGKESNLLKSFRHELDEDMPFYDGESLWLELNALVNVPGWSLDSVIIWVRRWINLIIKHASIKGAFSKNTLLPGKYHDALPFNILIDKKGTINIIDLEWVSEKEVELGYVIFRGVVHSLLRITSASPSVNGNNLYLLDVAREILTRIDLAIGSDDIDAYWNKEFVFMEKTQLNFNTDVYQNFSKAIIKTRLPIIEYINSSLEENKINNEMKIREENLYNKIESLEEVIKLKDNQLSSAAKDKECLMQELSLVEDKADGLVSHISYLEQSLAVNTREVRELNEKVTHLLNTNSWKLTKPLRFAMRLARGQHETALQPLKQKSRAVLKSVYYKAPPAYRHKLLQTAFKLRPTWFTHHPEYLRNKGGQLASITSTTGLTDFTSLPVLHKGSPGRVALHCHIYYYDLIDEFAYHISQIPFKIDVFVSVTSEAGRSSCKNALTKLSNIDILVVDIVPNIGRDIGPMLAHFGNKLKGYDYIGHIQSKKSLYNSGATQGWREYLFNSLLGSTENIERIFSQFMENPRLGIIYPQAFVQVPYAAFTWLANRKDGQELCDRMNIPMPDAYFNFPAGSMFWARTDALRPLLDLNLGWEDFPKELAQNDGTVAHAIERLLGIVPAALDYDALIIKDHGSPSWSTFRFDQQYFGRSFDSYRYLINDADTQLIAFDIFDTLLTRPLINPDHTKKIVVERLNQTEASLFSQYRATAEAQARQEAGRDIDINKIYQNFSKLSGLPASRCQELAILESNIELASVCARPDAVKLLQMAKEVGKRVVLISDMFLPESVIMQMLEKNNIIGWDKIYLSSTVGCRKDTGDLYKHVFEKERVAGKNVVMIGDNERSDLQLPADNFGVRCLHLLRANDVAKSLPFYQKMVFDKSILNNLNNELTLGLIIQKNLNKIAEVDPDDLRLYSERPYQLGYNLVGPLLVSFSDWLLDTAKESSINELYFLAREGKIIKDVFDMWSATYGEKPESHYLQLSRRAVNVPGITTMEDVVKIAKIDFFPNKLSSFLFERFGLTLDNTIWQQIYEKGLWSEDKLVHIENSNLAEVEELLAFLLPEILNNSQAEFIAMQQYLNESGLSANPSSAIVDVGYSGTIQKALCSLIKRPVHGLYMATSNLIFDELPSSALARGCFVSESEPNFAGSKIFNRSFAIEQLLSANDAQIAKYIVDDNGSLSKSFKPLREQEKLTRPVRDTLQQGIMDYVRDACKLKREFYVDFKPSLYVADLLYTDFIESGAHRENTVLQNLILDDDYCGRGLVN